MGQDQDDLILAPYTTVQRRLAAIDYINGIYASAVSEEKSAAAIAEVEEILRRTHKLKESAENDFRVMSQSELIANSFINNRYSDISSWSNCRNFITGWRNWNYEYNVCFSY